MSIPHTASRKPGFAATARAIAVSLGLVLALLPEAPARAELVAVAQVAIGMECPECARNLRLAAAKLDGVETASTSWNRRILAVQLAPGNTCTLDVIRNLLRRQHFVPGEAEITVVGRIARPVGGPATLSVSGTDVVFNFDPRSEAASGLAAIGDGRLVRVRGRVAGEPVALVAAAALTAPAASRPARDHILGIIDVTPLEGADGRAPAGAEAPLSRPASVQR